MSLSNSDQQVLNRIFNPEMPYEQSEAAAGQPLSDTELEIADMTEEERDRLSESKKLEVEAIHAIERGDLSGGLDSLNRCVSLTPHRASCYNNRAQALQLRGDRRGALDDLESALRLSRGSGRVACQALTQRGVIHRAEGRDDEARQDFEAAARLGGPFAKQMLVEMNPYAALCNQMLREVIGQLSRPSDSAEDCSS
uniref:TPR_REGION domain-containing protein n=2 Tax=Macrostomum lignano TaxID=282301 RepID=A0A1I8GES6_9PLAT